MSTRYHDPLVTGEKLDASNLGRAPGQLDQAIYDFITGVREMVSPSIASFADAEWSPNNSRLLVYKITDTFYYMFGRFTVDSGQNIFPNAVICIFPTAHRPSTDVEFYALPGAGSSGRNNIEKLIITTDGELESAARLREKHESVLSGFYYCRATI